jgi:hypothetical protein
MARFNFGKPPLVDLDSGATIYIGSDRYPATVIRKTARMIETRRDKATPTDKHDYYGDQDYTYERDPSGEVERWYWSSRGWKKPGATCRIGERSRYSDPSF